MKHTVLLLLALCHLYRLSAQENRLSVVAEAGTGYGYHSNLPNFTSGYHHVSIGAGYRLKPWFSLGGALRYHSLDGPASNISGALSPQLSVMQQYSGIGLTVGPGLHGRTGRFSEASLAVRGGMLLQRIVQPMYTQGDLRRTIWYTPTLRPAVEVSGKWSFGMRRGVGIEIGLHYFSTIKSSKWMNIAREEGALLPDLSEEQTRYLNEDTRPTGYLSALAGSLGIRTQLGQKAQAAEIPDFRTKAFQWGWIVGAQVRIPNAPVQGWTSGIHTGLFLAQRLRNRLYIQAEPQIKFSQVRLTPLFFEDYDQNPVALGYGYRISYLGSFTMLELPVLLKWQSGQRHSWLAGLRPSVNTVRIYDAISGKFTVGTNVSASSFKDTNYRKGIRRFDTGISLGHEWRLRPALCLSLRYTQGLFDMTHDNFFKDTNTYTNSDVQTSLRWYF